MKEWNLKDGLLEVDTVLIKIPRLRFIEYLGSGANALCFKAEREMPNRLVAIKVWTNQKKYPLSKEKIIEEINKLALLNNKNIVQIYNADFIGELVYAELEYVNGITLKDWLKTEKPLLLRLVILEKLLSGVEYYHTKGVYHGDIHESNIMITSENEVKILDFGTSIFVRDNYHKSLVRESSILSNTCNSILPENRTLRFLDNDLSEYSPEYVREAFYSLSKLILNLSNTKFEDDISCKNFICNLAATVAEIPLYDINRIIKYLRTIGISNAMIGGFVDIVNYDCCEYLRLERDKGLKFRQVSEEYIVDTINLYFQLKETCKINQNINNLDKTTPENTSLES